MEKQLTQQEQPHEMVDKELIMVDKEQIKEELKRQLQAFREYCLQVEKAAKEEAPSEEEGIRLH